MAWSLHRAQYVHFLDGNIEKWWWAGGMGELMMFSKDSAY